MNKYYTVLENKTDQQALQIIQEHLGAVTQVEGGMEVSFGMGNQDPRILLVLPDGVTPESIIPDLTFIPVEETTNETPDASV